MTPSQPAQADNTPQETLRLLRIYNYYRLILAPVLTLMFFLDWQGKLVGQLYPGLYLATGAGYSVFALAALVILGVQARPPNTPQLLLISIVDLGVLSVLTLASGGLESGIANLMIIAVAASSIFFTGTLSTFVAAVATLSVIGLNLYLMALHQQQERDFLQAGILGILLFITAWVFHTLAERIRRGYQITAAQSADIAQLEQINELIVQRMRTGILVTQPDHSIRLVNQAARELLALPENSPHRLSPMLVDRLAQWQTQPLALGRPFRVDPQGPEILAHFAPLHYGNTHDTLIFLEDNSRIAQQAQQMKLASLGRLTASIAHEIRNPLGAISHAAQLLVEDSQAPEGTRRLADIIQKHSRRMNRIIENVLQLSRRNPARPEPIALKPWLEQFCQDMEAAHPDTPPTFHVRLEPESLSINFDPGQLTQVLTNLCENALRHGRVDDQAVPIHLHGYEDPHTHAPILDVMDEGPGIPPELEERIFEPFFTTDSGGTGLGLFISHELCEFNQASLSYFRRDDRYTCFRLRFPHTGRRIALELE